MLDWVATNVDTIFEVIGIVVTASSGLVKLFSKYKWAAYLTKFCDWFSIVNTDQNKALIKSALKKKEK